jgi:UDP-GlcNAc:undecaprenyl-phosphate/decaprenyl-phosphate GlcNAc-1-phosphate transferase
LDGLDGLVSGVTTIGAIIIFIVSLTWDVPLAGTSALALIVSGLFGGFLIWNFFPAKIFLGEAGSTLAGFLLGILAIISGGKIATALLVMGIPILDAVWVISRRLFLEKTSPTHADRKHLHFRLLDAGLSHRQAVLLIYLLVVLFGSLSLYNTTQGKLILLGLVVVTMLVLAAVIIRRHRET